VLVFESAQIRLASMLEGRRCAAAVALAVLWIGASSVPWARAAPAVPCGGLYSLVEPIDAATTCLSLSAGNDSFNALLRPGTRATAVVLLLGRNVFFDGAAQRNSPIGPVVEPLRTHLAWLGFATLSIETPNIAASADSNLNNRADFAEYDAQQSVLMMIAGMRRR
jgi:hypothetical protein